MNVKWVHKFPSKPGDYWFAGERFGRNDYVKERGEKPKYEMILCSVRKIANGVMVVGDGYFIYDTELGDEWYFAPAILPEMPKFKEEGTIRD
jgi:hypothetical protein